VRIGELDVGGFPAFDTTITPESRKSSATAMVFIEEPSGIVAQVDDIAFDSRGGSLCQTQDPIQEVGMGSGVEA